jgi:hypothetical protein
MSPRITLAWCDRFWLWRARAQLMAVYALALSCSVWVHDAEAQISSTEPYGNQLAENVPVNPITDEVDRRGQCVMANSAESDFPNSLVVHLVDENEGLVAAWYDGSTTRYPHGVLGDDVEASELFVIANEAGTQCSQQIVLDDNEVFEDLAPRLVDMDGDGDMDVVTIISRADIGARIAVFGYVDGDRSSLKLKASTRAIGTPFRWLAPIGMGDFNDDGRMDIAYIDRPHLARILRVVSYTESDELEEIASAPGFTNHRIGEDFISSGVRSCDGQLQLVTADSRWERILLTSVKEATLVTEDVGPFSGVDSIRDALECTN